jgi:hypothetical protein
VTDHDVDDVAGRKAVAPVGEALVVEFSVVGQRADGREPAPVTFAQPLQQFASGGGVAPSTGMSGGSSRRIVPGPKT